MRVKVFGVQFRSKRALAEFLGCSYTYAPRQVYGEKVAARDRLNERDIMTRFNFRTKAQAAQWLRQKVKEAKANAGNDN